jgi:cysteinyl-tRNA synthetase
MRAPVFPSGALELIGNTPLVRLRRLCPNPEVEIWVKLESHNPGGSVKDRVAKSMLEAAEQSGELTRDKIILEATSGNTGIGLALVGSSMGYKVLLAMSEAVSQERRQILAALGAEFLLTPPKLGTDGAIEVVYRLTRREPGKYFIPDQYNNPANPGAHYHGTGPEILAQTGGRITHLVAAMGTSGTLMGLSARLWEHDPAIRIIGVEPFLGHKIQGLKNMKEAYRPGIFDRKKLSEKVNVADEDAYAAARLLAREEGLFVGMSSGAALHVALLQARCLERGVLVAILPDGGERYLSTSLFALAAPQEKRALELELHDTLTRARRRFVPIAPGKVSMYTCGPTVDAPPTLALLRRMLVADLLRRTLEHFGLEVRHVVNITDLDDNTIQASERQGVPLAELTARETEGFLAALDALGIKRAWRYPRASEHVDDMAAFARRLVDKGFAYERLRSVYFDIGKHPRYGALSGLNLAKIRVGTTVDLDEYEKDDPRDFTLFKRSTLAEMARDIFFETEWGNVRPGLHVECACMSTRYLGEEFDIHTGSSDLIFPHNENEMAQCEALHGKPQARTWLHSEAVLVDGKKMSRPAGNAVTLADVQALGYTGRELRTLLLSFHYRQPLTYSPGALELARAALRRIDTFVWLVSQAAQAEAPGHPEPEPAPLPGPLVEGACPEAGPESVTDSLRVLAHEFDAALQADLNAPRALGALFSLIRKLNPRLVQGRLTRAEAALVLDALRRLEPVLGVLDFAVATPRAEDAELEARVHAREAARERKDYAEADRIRDELRARGVVLEDTVHGTLFWIGPPAPTKP